MPGADWRDIEDAITTLQIRKHHGEIRTSVRAYLRGIIAKGDAWSIANEAAAQRRSDEAAVARYGDPFAISTQSPRTFTPTPTPPKFTAPPPADRPRPESIEAARTAARPLRRAPSPTGDPLCDLAAAQLGEARAARATQQPESA